MPYFLSSAECGSRSTSNASNYIVVKMQNLKVYIVAFLIDLLLKRRGFIDHAFLFLSYCIIACYCILSSFIEE